MSDREHKGVGEARAARYRARSVELRAVAESLKDPDAITMILATAKDYERMADALERSGHGE